MLNVGKSIFLGVIFRVKFAVGYYVFIILRLNIGKLNYDEFLIIVVDILGFIKGVYENRGFGYVFLRYIERIKILAYVVDLVVVFNGRKGVLSWE